MKPERLSAAQVRPLGLNKPIPFEYSLCVKVEGHDHIKALNVVKDCLLYTSASQRRDIVAVGSSIPDFLELLIVSRQLLVVVVLGGKYL